MTAPSTGIDDRVQSPRRSHHLPSRWRNLFSYRIALPSGEAGDNLPGEALYGSGVVGDAGQ